MATGNARRIIQIAAAASALATLAAASFVAGRASGERIVATRVNADEQSAPLRSAIAENAVALQQESARAERAISALTHQMISMQTRLVYLDALAARVVESTDIPPEDFDFRVEPPR